MSFLPWIFIYLSVIDVFFILQICLEISLEPGIMLWFSYIGLQFEERCERSFTGIATYLDLLY
jgi:hypothetical protein